VKVTPKGRKVFIVMYRVGGAGSRLRKYTIGPYGRVTLPMARAQAQKIFAAKLDGRDMASEKRESRRRLVVDRTDGLIETYLRERVASLRTAKAIAGRFQRDVLPRWSEKSIHEIKKRDVIELIAEVAQRSPIVAHQLLKTIRTFFKWCIGRDVLEFSPSDGVPSPGKEKSRDRVLTDQELTQVMRAARQMDSPFGRIVDFLTLTGQRREEVARMTWDEVDESTRTWCLPGDRTKNGRPHIVHLSGPAWNVLESCHRQNAYVFSTVSGARPVRISGWHKRALDARCGVVGWRLHDLRRTAVTGMARLGVAPHIADKVLNHQTGTISGVAAVYQRHDFLAERKDALDRWAAHVQQLVMLPRRAMLPVETFGDAA
jgi:integrase